MTTHVVTKEALRKLRSHFGLTLRGLGLAWECSPGYVVAILVLSLVIAILQLAMAWVGKAVVDAVVAHSTREAARWVLTELGLVVAFGLLNRALSFCRVMLGNWLALDIQQRIIEKAATLELAQLEDSEVYDRLNRATREATSRPLEMLNRSIDFLQGLLTLGGYGAILLSYSPWAVAVMALASLPSTYVEARFSQRIFGIQNWRSPKRRRIAYLEFLLTRDIYAKEVRLLGLARHFLDRYREDSRGFVREDRDLYLQRNGWSFGLSIVSDGAFYGCYVMIALSAARGAITVGMLTLYMVAFRQGQQAFQTCLSAVGNLYESSLYLSNLFDFLGVAALPSRRPAEPEARPEAIAGSRDGVVFENVSFRYPGRENWSLRHVSFHVPRGGSLAIVGQNGAGKSSLIKLLCRFYDPTEGRILYDGKDLRDWDRAKLWARIGAVFQDFARYQFTFAENVGLGNLPELADRAKVEAASESGGAGEVFRGLPQGLDTQLGRWFAEGTELSGGQWQKTALARAFMREEAELLILDEPTSALDAGAEARVYERFRALARGKTSFIISHRFPTARLADRILVLEQGRVAELGGHAELLRQEGEYARLFLLQAEGYS